ncbi:DUF2690 domain-containing protein [Rhodococcus pyridinivorans]
MVSTLNRGTAAVTSLLAATLMALLVILAGATPASAAPTSGDPAATGCSANASNIWKRNINFVDIEVRYSPKCGTNWIRVTGAQNRQAVASVWSPKSGWQSSMSYGKAPSQFWTPMVYAPGSTCILFQVKFSKIGQFGTYDTGRLSIC